MTSLARGCGCSEVIRWSASLRGGLPRPGSCRPFRAISYHTGWPRFKGKGHRPHLSMERNVKERADTPWNHSNRMLLRSECAADLLLATRCWAVLFSENRPPPQYPVCSRGQFFPRGVLQKGNAGAASLPGMAHDTMTPSLFRGSLAHWEVIRKPDDRVR